MKSQVGEDSSDLIKTSGGEHVGESAKAGYVYVLSNDGFKENCFKIGKTKELPAYRALSLSSKTCTPADFMVVYQKRVQDRAKAESIVHRLLSSYRFRKNREFFVVPQDIAISAVDKAAQETGELEDAWAGDENLRSMPENERQEYLRQKKIADVDIKDEHIIKMLESENPKKENTDAWWKFHFLQMFDNKTVKEYRDAVSRLKKDPEKKGKKYGLTAEQAKKATATGAGTPELRWCLYRGRQFIELE